MEYLRCIYPEKEKKVLVGPRNSNHGSRENDAEKRALRGEAIHEAKVYNDDSELLSTRKPASTTYDERPDDLQAEPDLNLFFFLYAHRSRGEETKKNT